MIKFCIAIISLLSFLSLQAQKRQNTFLVKKASGLNFPYGADYRTMAAGCDTVNFPVPNTWNFAYYLAGTGGSDGFVTGNNAFSDQEKAAYFDVSYSADIYLTKVWIAFAVANSNIAANLAKTIAIKIYDGTTGAPGNLLTTINRSLSELHADQLNNSYSEIIFPSAVALPESKKFFVSVNLTNLSWSQQGGYDSLAIFSNQANQSAAGANGLGWEESNNNTWATLNAGWGIDLSLVVHPFISTNPTCALSTPTAGTYTFIGNGNWTEPLNWSNHLIPPVNLLSGSEIIIDPVVDGECVLNIAQTISPGGKVTVQAGKKLRILGDIVITN